jgi:hypothetical protein
MVDVGWVDAHGRARQATALLEDIARSGACLQFEIPVPMGAVLRISCPQGVLEGVVRYCAYREIGYFVGVQFAETSKWSRQEYQPRHMLDLERLMAAGKRERGE